MSFRKTLRSLHRDLGYFFVGLSIIYGVSGIILVFKQHEKDPAFKEISVNKSISQNLTPNELTALWQSEVSNEVNINRVIPYNDVYRLYLHGGIGQYNPANGNLSFKTYQKRPVVKLMNDIHYNAGKKFTWLGNIFAISLLFFALSGLIMLKGKKGFLKRGWWIMALGIAGPIIWYLLV